MINVKDFHKIYDDAREAVAFAGNSINDFTAKTRSIAESYFGELPVPVTSLANGLTLLSKETQFYKGFATFTEQALDGERISSVLSLLNQQITISHIYLSMMIPSFSNYGFYVTCTQLTLILAALSPLILAFLSKDSTSHKILKSFSDIFTTLLQQKNFMIGLFFTLQTVTTVTSFLLGYHVMATLGFINIALVICKQTSFWAPLDYHPEVLAGLSLLSNLQILTTASNIITIIMFTILSIDSFYGLCRYNEFDG